MRLPSTDPVTAKPVSCFRPADGIEAHRAVHPIDERGHRGAAALVGS